ncbi:MAG: exonuclease domain-containing protein, partial [Actinomycetaceae bacterium]|nr:exonuclease domain-containing protein [Actinomycetaceae bacterium]
MWEKTYVVVDLETTGLSATDQITEIGAVKVRGQKVVEQFNTLVNPGVEIPPRITALTGITDSMVEDAPTPGEAIAAFLEFAELENSILIAHNASFDTGFLIRGAEAADLKWPKPTVIDTLALARTILPRPLISNHRLATLVKYFGVVNPSSHRALADATVTADVFAGLVNRLDEAGATDFADLFVAAQPVPYRHRKKVALAKDLPAEPGVYRFLSADGLTLYVGSATNLRSRVRSYFSASEKRRRIHAMLDQVDSLKVEVTSTPLEARVRELHAIAGERPLFNSASRHQEDTAWLVLENGFLRVVHTITPQQAPSALGPYRRVTHALKAREAILLTLGQDPMVLADLPVGDVGVDNEELATLCLQGRGHKVSETLLAIMSELSTQSQYEFAARIRDYFSYYLQGIERQRDTAL